MRLIIANCRIEYEGRINTSLDLGERLIIIKEDGSFSLQNDSGYKPLNYMTSPTKIDIDGYTLDLEQTNLPLSAGSVITVEHLKTKEKLYIEIQGIKMDQTIPIYDTAEMLRVGSEKDFQFALTQNADVIEKGLVITEREKQLKVGAIDLYGYDKHNCLAVIEVKRAVVTSADVDQLARYVEEIKETVNKACRGILVAPRIMPQAEVIMRKRKLEFIAIKYQDIAPNNSLSNLPRLPRSKRK